MDGEPTRVAKTIQHIASLGQLPNTLTVVTLVEVEASFVA